MVEYIPIDDSEVEPEAPVISSLGVRWRDNPIAIAEGADGAPRVKSPAIDWSSVSSEIGRSQLKTATGSVTHADSDAANLTLPGGQYGFYPQIKTEGSIDRNYSIASDFSNSSYTANISFFSSSTNPGYARQRYIQSSPPYDHGDGEVQGYGYASLDANGRVVSMYLAEDPPWYGNTQNTPGEQWRDEETGKEYQRTRKLKCCKKDVDEGRISMAEFIERAGQCEDVVEEITPEVKLRGMDELPHPFVECEGRTIVLLDPMDEKIGRLIRMMQAGEKVYELFNEGYLIVDNEPCKRCGPPGVPVHGVKWRKT